MNYNKLDPKIIFSWRIARLIRFAVVAVIFAIPTLILSSKDFFPELAPYVYSIEVLLLLYLLITPFLYPFIEYRQWGYIVSEDRVEIRRGIFFIHTTIIPVIRIQHVTISQGPINRRLGLSSVDINTASGAFSIVGLSDQNAREITEVLKARLYTRLEAQDKV